jgi:hypothetical protein
MDIKQITLPKPSIGTVVPAPAGSFQPQPLTVDLGTSDAEQVSARTIILYGDSGLGKSTNARFFAQWMYERTGKPSRLVAFEDSSKVVFQPLIDLGLVEAVFLTKAQNPLVAMRRLARGEWPIFASDHTIKEWKPLQSWAGSIAAYIIEGLTSGSESLLEEAREEHRFLREQKTDAFEIGGEKFASSSQTAFGFVQQEMLRNMKGFGMLPVERVLWTGHECVGSDEDTKDPIRGPGLVGKAATDKVRKYCGLLLHIDGVKQQNGMLKPRIYFRKHPDPKFVNIFYPAKTTLPVEMVPELEKVCPGGYFEPGVRYGEGLDKFLQIEADLIERFKTDTLLKWKQQVEQKLGARKQNK